MTGAGTGRLQDRVALISGAGAGIGEAVARRFAREGAVLWLNDIDAGRLEALVAELAAGGSEVTGTPGDMSQPAFVEEWVAAAAAVHGRLDVLYNNVGVARLATVAEVSDEDWHYQQRVTLDSVFFATRAVIPHMVHQGRGSIISMSSGAGVGGEYGLGAYGAAKAGVINLMETVAMEYGPAGIRANAVTPGPTATAPMLAAAALSPGGAEEMARDLMLGRLSRPEEVANLVLFLASDESSNITGVCIRSNIRSKHRLAAPDVSPAVAGPSPPGGLGRRQAR